MFLRAHELYQKEYDDNPRYVKIGEHKIPLPKQPEDRLILNSDLSSKHQKFQRNIVPRDIRSWKKSEERAYVEAEYHKREHGQWQYIKGRPFYIPGSMYPFMSYWFMETGSLPTFRIEALEFFLFWEYVRDHPDAMGYFIIKCRRLGDTEKALYVCWDEATRWRKSNCMMQNYSGDQNKKNFRRLAIANRKMIYFFKPKNRGMDIPDSFLDFSYSPDVQTKKKQRKQQESSLFLQDQISLGLESGIQAFPSVTRAGDGSRWRIAYLDEAGKMKVAEINVTKQIDILSKTMTMHNDADIIGKFQLTTTVEDVDSGKSVEKCRKLWNDADINNLDENGRTLNGLFRLFRGYELAAKVDEYGFHKRKEARKRRNATLKKLEEAGQFDRIVDLKRKQPASVKESLVTPAKDCILYPQLLDQLLERLRENTDPFGQKYATPLTRRGNLMWMNGVRFGKVQWMDDPNGLWEISQHPVTPNARNVNDGGLAPASGHIYSCGIDPIDSTKGSGSDLAINVHRRLDFSAEKGLEFDPAGNVINDWDMITNQTVCTYRNRPGSEAEIIEHVLLTLFYYSVPAFIETQKGRFLINTLTELNLFPFIQLRPIETFNNPMSKTTQADVGAAASTGIIHLYVNAIKFILSNYPNVHKHLEVLEDAREFNMDNRSDRDSTVAWGYALLGAMDSSLQSAVEEHEEEWTEAPWAM